MSLLDLIQSNPEEAQAAIFAALNDRAFDYLDNYKLDETAYQSDIEHKVVQESTDDQSEDFDDEELDEAVVAGSVKKDAKGNVESFKTVGDKTNKEKHDLRRKNLMRPIGAPKLTEEDLEAMSQEEFDAIDEDQLDELSKDTLKSYIKKANIDKDKAMFNVNSDTVDDKTWAKSVSVANKCKDGIQFAGSKLTK